MTKEDNARETISRSRRLAGGLASLLVQRVEAQGPNLMFVSFDEWMRMQDDPEYRSLAQYSQQLLRYENGAPRPAPLRPLMQNEVGMYRDFIVCMKGNNPDDDGRRWIQSGFEVPAPAPTKDHSDE